MQFVNIVVHSVENMNFRVHLQHEFSIIGLDDYLEVCTQYQPRHEKTRNIRPLTIFCGCTVRFVSGLVGKPEDLFSHDAVPI